MRSTAFFYTKQEMGLRMAYWFGFAAVAGAFGGLIAFGVQHAKAAISDWRLLFIVEVCMPLIFVKLKIIKSNFRESRLFLWAALLYSSFQTVQSRPRSSINGSVRLHWSA